MMPTINSFTLSPHIHQAQLTVYRTPATHRNFSPPTSVTGLRVSGRVIESGNIYIEDPLRVVAAIHTGSP